ncbi:MAG TPA: glycerol-3-phosphate acyltransferase [Actinomycetales bacterium]|nr:glycerol-3-phosphate acyltransferase [Actinomycetales bacterium]
MSTGRLVSLVLLVVGGYLVGSVSPAAVLARRLGADLRGTGSGNPGATNAGRVLGPRWGVVVGVLDVLKGLLPSVVALWLLGRPLAYAVALATVLGHVSSPFLRGRGGKGVATSLGALLALAWWWLGAVVAVFVAVLALTRWVGGASTAAALALLPACLLLAPAPGVPADLWSRLFGCGLVVVVLARHRTNLLGRLRQLRG